VRNEQVQLLQQLQESEDGLCSTQEIKRLDYPATRHCAGSCVVDDNDEDDYTDDDDEMPEELDALTMHSADDNSVMRASMRSKESIRRKIEKVTEEEVEKPIKPPVLVVRHGHALMSPNSFIGPGDEEDVSDDSNPSCGRGIDDVSVLTETPSERGMIGRFMERVNLSSLMTSAKIESMPPPITTNISIQTVSTATVGPCIERETILLGPVTLANNRYAPRRSSSQSFQPIESRRGSIVGELTDMNINEWRSDGTFYSEIDVSSVAKKTNLSSWCVMLRESEQEKVIAETDESSNLDSWNEKEIMSMKPCGQIRQIPSHGSVRSSGLFGMNPGM
jgi:hypothetical protein